MTTLAVDTPRTAEVGDRNHFPVIASDIIWNGAAVGLVKASGHARPLTSVDEFVGFAVSKVDNSAGAAAACNVEVKKRGQVELPITGAVITDVGVHVYATDDNAFSFTPAGGVFIGFVKRFVSSGVVIVEFDVDALVDPWADYLAEALGAATKTLDVQDQGKVICVTVDSVVTLPATAVAINCVLLNCGPYSTVQISADPVADDLVIAPDIAGTNNKDLINTKATAQRGDYAILQGGHADGWTAKVRGVWAEEG